MRFLRLGLAIVPALALAAGGAGAAQVRLEYDAYYRFLRIAALTSELALEPTSYRLAMTIRTMGIVGALVPWTLRSESNGNLEPAGLQPLAHRSDSVYRGDRWVVIITYDGESPRVRVEDPDDRRGEREDGGDSLVTRTWLAAPRPGAPPTPVEIEMTGRRGTLRIYLRDVVAAAP